MAFREMFSWIGRMGLIVGMACLLGSGCSTTAQNVALGVGIATVLGAQSPNNEIEQIYYLGVFDPQDQLPPEIYRVRVHGQSSAISNTHFASGWVPAGLVDSLGSKIALEDGQVKIEKAEDDLGDFQTGRKLMMFGPEGFRPAPKNHRLVIVMGSSPEVFFSAVDEALGIVAQATQGGGDAALDRRLFEALVRIGAERERVDDIILDTVRDLDQGGTTP